MENPFIKKRTTLKEIFNNDKELEELYNQIVELLIQAGYFRARIQSLEPFDKILGGLAWTLTGCFYDIDIDFKDDMNLTEKIRVSEKIVAGLKSINCPFQLNPIQIQGLDLKPIFQTLQWLVKRLLETRDERNEMNKRFSVNYIEPRIEKPKPIQKNDDIILSAVYNELKPNRQFRPKAKLAFDYNDELRVFFGMIEFGLNKEIAFQKQLIELLKKKNLIAKDTGDTKGESKKASSTMTGNEPNKLTKEEMKTLNDLVTNNIEEISKTNNQKVNAGIIEAIFSENMTAIADEIEHFENSKGDEGIDQIKLMVKEKERLEQNKLNILSQISTYENELNGIKKETNEGNDEINRIKNEIEQLEKTLEQNKINKDKIIQKVKEEKLSEEKLKFLSQKNKEKEELKTAISRFKKDCLDEKKKYDAQLENYEKKIAKLNDEENLQLFNEIDTSYNAELEKNLKTKKELFEKNKEINKLTRKIQLYPSKLEIIQYQKRFQELYDQINNVSEKSMKIIGESNSKNGVVTLLERRLNDFMELRNLYKTLKNKREKEDFKVTLLNAFQNLVESIIRSTEKLADLTKDIDDNQKQLNDLQLYELNYMKLIKEYNKEYNRYNAMAM